MTPGLTDAIMELGNDFYNTLPSYDDPSYAEDDYDPETELERFITSEVNSFQMMLEDHLATVCADWRNQRDQNEDPCPCGNTFSQGDERCQYCNRTRSEAELELAS